MIFKKEVVFFFVVMVTYEAVSTYRDHALSVSGDLKTLNLV